MAQPLPIGDMGPAQVTWDPDGTPVNFGPFKGPIELTASDEVNKIFEEGYGAAPVDAVFAGTVMELSMPMTRSTLQQLLTALPGSSLNGGGDVLTISNKCGGNMYPDAKPVVIKPMVDNVATAVKTKWTRVFKCYPFKAYSITFSNSDQRVLQVKFMVFPSQESGEVGKYHSLGSI